MGGPCSRQAPGMGPGGSRPSIGSAGHAPSRFASSGRSRPRGSPSRCRFPRSGGGRRASSECPPLLATVVANSAGAVHSIASSVVEAKHDVLIVGAGCAGMRAAIEAHDAGADVAVVSKLHPTRSHSGAAEGGINAALGNKADDSPETHAFDTVKGSDYLGDQDAIEVFTAEAPQDIYQLEHWGAVFSRNAEGRLDHRPFGAAGSPRTVYAA